MGISLNEKIHILENMISNTDIHINVLLEDTQSNPNGDADGKQSRLSVLNDFMHKKAVLQGELEALTN